MHIVRETGKKSSSSIRTLKFEKNDTPHKIKIKKSCCCFFFKFTTINAASFAIIKYICIRIHVCMEWNIPTTTIPTPQKIYIQFILQLCNFCIIFALFASVLYVFLVFFLVGSFIANIYITLRVSFFFRLFALIERHSNKWTQEQRTADERTLMKISQCEKVKCAKQPRKYTHRETKLHLDYVACTWKELILIRFSFELYIH